MTTRVENESTTRAGGPLQMPGSRKTKFKRSSARLTTPERLDRMLSVTRARGWIALLAILVVAVAVGVWSVVGEVATYVEARGFLLNRDGKVVDAVATGPGRLRTIAVSVGDEVEKDALVALVANEELAARYASARAFVVERTRALDALKAEIAAESRITSENSARRRKHLDELEATALDMLDVARVNLENSRQLFERRIISRLNLESTQQEVNEARRVLLDLGRERDTLEANEIRYRNENATRIREMTAQVESATHQARELEVLLAAERVLAPVSGQVIEIKVASGAIVDSGTAVASIRTGTTELEVLLYVPPDEGRQVEAGMPALVSPAAVRREEFGAIRGRVESLSSFPVSFEGMVAVLQNRELAQSFFSDGPPYAGRIALVPDPATASGLAWTSPKAASQTLDPGTLASVEIKTRSQPPITLAIPLLKEFLGLR